MLTLVPAYNEAPTIGPIVRALLPVMGEVYVVNDGSTDATAEIALAEGASVITTPRNLGKGGAMLFALQLLPPDDAAFFDADLQGFRSEHAAALVHAFGQGYDMVCGLRDRGPLSNTAQLVAPLITGERILRRWVLEGVPADCWAGYAIETAMNAVVRRGGGRTALLTMRGVDIRTKLEKVGFWGGVKGHWKMFRQIMQAERALAESCCASCAKGSP